MEQGKKQSYKATRQYVRTLIKLLKHLKKHDPESFNKVLEACNGTKEKEI